MVSRCRAATIRDTLPARTCWADLVDSSQDISKDETVPPIADESYDGPAVGVENLTHNFLKSGPIDFTFLAKEAEASGADAPVASSSLSKPRPPSSPGLALNSSGGSKVLAMPPPTLQAATKSRRSRAKRPLSTVQESAGKRTREQPTAGQGAPLRQTLLTDSSRQQEVEPAQPQQRSAPFLEPPPATEEEWQHRIHKRHKVVTSIKETPEYQAYLAGRPPAERLDGEPQTPTAEDRNLSKRRWEYEIQQWRTHLKQWYAANAAHARAGPDAEGDDAEGDDDLSQDREST